MWDVECVWVSVSSYSGGVLCWIACCLVCCFLFVLLRLGWGVSSFAECDAVQLVGYCFSRCRCAVCWLLLLSVSLCSVLAAVAVVVAV